MLVSLESRPRIPSISCFGLTFGVSHSPKALRTRCALATQAQQAQARPKTTKDPFSGYRPRPPARVTLQVTLASAV